MMVVYPRIKVFTIDAGTPKPADVEREHNDWMKAQEGKSIILGQHCFCEIAQRTGEVKVTIIVQYTETNSVSGNDDPSNDDDGPDGAGGRGNDKPS